MKGQRKPTRLKILHGEKNKDRINANEPKPRLGIPTCPSHLNTPARGEWKRVIVELDRCGLMTLADRSVLAGYCQLYGEWVEIARTIKNLRKAMSKSEVADEITAYMRQIISLVKMQSGLIKDMNSLGGTLGLSPASRSKISLPEPETGKSAFEAALD